MRIQNNIMAMNTHRFYTVNNSAVAKSAEKLSSGYRINRAGDDAAGLAISEKMRAQIRGLSMASKNSQDAISLVQTAEGALQEVHAMLQRMNELAVQASSDTNDDTVDRAALQQEFANLQDEIDQVSRTVKFNDMALFTGNVDENGVAVAAAVSIPETSAQTGTPTTDGAITFAVQDDGTVKASVDGTADDANAVTIGGTAGLTDLTGEDTDTVGTAGTVTVAYDGVTTTLNVTADATIKEVKDAINGLTYEVETTTETTTGASTIATTPAATNLTNQNVGSLSGVSVTYAAATDDNATTDTGAVTFAKNANDATKIDLLVGGQVKATSAAVTAMTVSGTTSPTDQVLDFGAYGKLTIASTDTTDGNSATVVNLTDAITANGAVTATLEAGATNTTTTTAVKADSLASTGVDDSNAKEWVIQVGAEEGHTLNIKIGSISTTGLKLEKLGSGGANVASIDSRENASKAITSTRAAINQVSTQRAELGAMQNRLDHKISNLDNTVENVSAAESRIRDVDMAKEMTNFTKNNILAQAATAMLAQANANPQGVLSLLQ